MNSATIFDIMHDYVVFATGLPGKDVRITRPNAGLNVQNDRGTVATIGLINSTPIGQDAEFFNNIDGNDDDVEEIVSANRRLTASIKIFGGDSEDLINKVSSNLKRQGAKDIFYNGGESIGILTKGEVLNLSTVLNGSYNEIRQLDIRLYINHVEGQNINAINSATIGVEIQNGSQKLETTIEVQQ